MLEVRIEGNMAVTQCPICREQGRFELPAEARGFLAALVGVVSAEQRIDRQSVKVQQTQAGLVALLCPQCGAAVRPADGDTVECSYCKAVAFLPARVRTRGGGQIVQAPIFWVAIRGPSTKRAELEQPRPEATKNAMKAAAGVLKRGISPLPGIELAPPRGGLDWKQLALTVGLTALALLIGGAVIAIDGAFDSSTSDTTPTTTPEAPKPTPKPADGPRKAPKSVGGAYR
jgi:hypothetical protein